MRFLRRSAALVLSLLLVQLSLVGSKASCVAHGDDTTTPLTHSGMSTGDSGMDPAHNPDSPADDCTMPPWAPNDCSMPVSCAAPLLPTAATATLADVDPDSDLWADLSAAAPSPLIPPDPPPPRT